MGRGKGKLWSKLFLNPTIKWVKWCYLNRNMCREQAKNVMIFKNINVANTLVTGPSLVNKYVVF